LTGPAGPPRTPGKRAVMGRQKCKLCGKEVDPCDCQKYRGMDPTVAGDSNACPNCGRRMRDCVQRPCSAMRGEQ
jgi:hypothetical protein